jgi:hypothetical protein
MFSGGTVMFCRVFVVFRRIAVMFSAFVCHGFLLYVCDKQSADVGHATAAL